MEDKLTGDIFGAMRYLPSKYLLLPFLRKAYWVNPETHERQSPQITFSSEPEIVFWPRHYPSIEPDVEIKGPESGGQIKILIEVKYKSGLSSDDNHSGHILASESNNQLIKQAQALADDGELSKKLLIFLTEDGSYPREILNRVTRIMWSEPILCNIELYWISWHDLTSVISNLLVRNLSIFENRVAEDLMHYCNRKGFRRYEYHSPRRVRRWGFTSQLIPQSSSTPLFFTFISNFFRHADIAGKKWSFAHE